MVAVFIATATATANRQHSIFPSELLTSPPFRPVMVVPLLCVPVSCRLILLPSQRSSHGCPNGRRVPWCWEWGTDLWNGIRILLRTSRRIYAHHTTPHHTQPTNQLLYRCDSSRCDYYLDFRKQETQHQDKKKSKEKNQTWERESSISTWTWTNDTSE